MRKFFLALAGVAMMAGTSLTAAPAMARPGDHYQSQHHRHHYRPRHHRQVCRTVVKKKVVWRHHRKHVVRYKVRRCHPVR